MEQPRKIGIITISSMIALALLFDAMSIIPIINLVSGFLAWLVFATWFYLLGLGLANPQRMATMGISFLAEMIPFISMLPTITFGVVIIIALNNHPVAANIVSQKLPSNKNKNTNSAQQAQPTTLSQKSFQASSQREETPPLPEKKSPTLADIVPIRTVQPQDPGYAKLPDETGMTLPQRRRLPPDINPAAPYGEEEDWGELLRKSGESDAGVNK